MEGTRIGAFVVDRLLGEGGMGAVYAGHHEQSGLPVAIKVADRLSEALRPTFLREVEAMAALDHPGIAMVHDHGTLPDGSPWLVMEVASGGTLERALRPTTWSGLLGTLLSILDALAHAHARGVVHRDLKPPNVLICDTRDLRPGLKLADFGLAVALDGREVLIAGAGTPAYMAPEQVLGQAWALGPWTDLYALGGIAWELATGRRVFPGEDPKAVGKAQVNAPLPAFEPVVPVPPELAGWLRSLLDKDPGRRPESAAWCAAELLAMGPAERQGRAEPAPAARPEALFTLVPDTAVTEDLEDVPTLVAITTTAVRSTQGDVPGRVPTRLRLDPPAQWRQSEAVRPRDLTRAGLGLFGLRPAPFEGRTAERQRLWSLLRLVARVRVPQLAILRGAEGLGCSRLAGWVGQRAVEVGAAKLLTVRHAAEGRGGAALVEQVARLRGVPASEAEARAQRLGVPLATLQAAIQGEPVDDLMGLQLRLLAFEARQGPVVLWLDDAHLDERALALAAAVLDAGALRELPVLVLATVDDDAVVRRLPLARSLERLAARQGVHTVPLGPLGPEEMSRLLLRMLPLHPGLVARVSELAGGNPLLATQTLGAWLQAGALIPRATGYALKRGAGAPGDLRAVWEGRMGPLIRPWTPAERHAVAAAAVLGLVVERETWVALCERLLIPPAESAISDLQRAGLVSPTDDGFRFAHGLVRAVLLELAVGVRPEFEAAAAEVVPREQDERVGRHLVGAGRPLKAFPRLLSAAGRRVDREQYGGAMALVEEMLECLETAGVPPNDERWGQARSRRVLVLVSDWQLELALEEGQELIARGREYGWDVVIGELEPYVGVAALRLRRFDLANAMFASGRDRWPPDTVQHARALRGLGHVCQAQAKYAEAEAYYRAYAAIAAKLEDPFLRASAHNDLGAAAVRSGRREEALAHYAKGLELCVKHGFKDKTIARVNVIGQLLEERRFDVAHEQALLCLGEAEEQFSLLASAAAHVLSLRTAAVVGDWETWARVAPRVRTLVASARLVDESIGECMYHAGNSCSEAGYSERAAFAFQIAAEQFAALDRPVWQEKVQAAIARLGAVEAGT